MGPDNDSDANEDELYEKRIEVRRRMVPFYRQRADIFDLFDDNKIYKLIATYLGKPFYYTGETHPDWAPSLNFDKVYVNAKSAMDRESRRVILNVQRAFQEMVQDPEQVPIENVHLNEEVVNISLAEGHEELFPPLCTEAE
ncbi:hypothetical protein OUZ56_012087 [Daphnia magna]|uniref:Uncharacterized protein n=1 Tax=Daphnia magna TaxID=35525 RepID=A0ABQ9Z204_9CRUS|nr:hypothetical protein OUZ56_012087 [Daphnia magna]